MTGTNTDRPHDRQGASRWVLWLTVGVLIAAAVLGGAFIIIGDESNIAGRVWTTFVLVVLFAGAVVLDASVTGPNKWYLPASTVVNAALLIVGLLKIWSDWMQHSHPYRYYDSVSQFFLFIWLIILLRGGLLVTQLCWLHFVERAKRPVTRLASLIMLGFLWLTVLILALPASFPGAYWPGWWWRMSGATVLVAVVTALIPVVFRAFEPREPKQYPGMGQYGQYGGQQWQPGPPQQGGPQYGGPQQTGPQYGGPQWQPQPGSPQQGWPAPGPQQGWAPPSQGQQPGRPVPPPAGPSSGSWGEPPQPRDGQQGDGQQRPPSAGPGSAR